MTSPSRGWLPVVRCSASSAPELPHCARDVSVAAKCLAAAARSGQSVLPWVLAHAKDCYTPPGASGWEASGDMSIT
jgi:hypothetical protein